MDVLSRDEGLDRSGELIRRMQDELHDLCQPLTALQVQLEVGKMLGDAVALREAIEAGLEEVNRMALAIQRMRERLQEEAAEVDCGDLAAAATSEECGGQASWHR